MFTAFFSVITIKEEEIMQVILKSEGKLSITGYTGEGHETKFDAPIAIGGENSAAKPMEVMLETLGACSYIDIMSILTKMRKTIEKFEIIIDAERAEEHPKVFTKVNIIYKAYSKDLKLTDLGKAVKLSQDKYCSVSAMFRNSGCTVNHTSEIVSE